MKLFVQILALIGVCVLIGMNILPSPSADVLTDIPFTALLTAILFSPILFALPIGLDFLSDKERTLCNRLHLPHGGNPLRLLLWILFLYLGVIVACEIILCVGDPAPDQTTVALIKRCTLGQRAVLAIVVCLLAPLTEELLFRGILFRTLPYGGWLSSLLFAFAHGVNAYLLPLFFFGTILMLLTRKTGSLLPAIILHILFNTVSFLFL